MNKKCTYIFLAVLVLSCKAKSGQLETVNLTGSGLGAVITVPLLGVDVSSIIDVDNISKVILLKAITSAPVGIDVNNILKTIEKATVFESHDLYLSEKMVWQAILVTKQGEYIQYLSDGKWVHITFEGGGGFFKLDKENF